MAAAGRLASGLSGLHEAAGAAPPSKTAPGACVPYEYAGPGRVISVFADEGRIDRVDPLRCARPGVLD